MASSDSSRPTPLGVARARFVDGLARKAQELRGSLALVAATPGDERPREEMRRRLHALYASAQVFQLEALAAALKEGIARLDHARDEKRSLDGPDLDTLAKLAGSLPALGAQGPSADPEMVVVPAAAPPPAILRPRTGRTLTRLPEGVSLPVPPPPEPMFKTPPPEPEPAPELPRAKEPTPTPEPAKDAVSLGQRLVESVKADRGPIESSRAPVLSVLVADLAEVQARVRALLSSERYEVLGAAAPEEALRLARSSAPDIVLCDYAILSRLGSDFVRRLRDDPLTDFVPVVALLPQGTEVDAIAIRELGAAEAIQKPIGEKVLEPLVERLGSGGTATLPGGLGGDLTVEEIARRIAEEIQRGLVESVDAGRGVSVPLGDGSEVLAAAWSAIGRVRATLAQRSGGRVHFRERGGAPSTLALVDEETTEATASDVSLRERRVLVVDDDPSVAWFFAGILRDAGAVVEEAHDGAQGLALARATRPDVIISDILMPEVDGFALLREVKRDPVLCDVPVVLLSWKEDFLQRMRELHAGASAYLKKEAGAAQVLAAVREVLRPRARLEQRVRAGGDVRGRLERIGVIPLLRTVAQLRPEARITVRDAWNLFEVDVRKGQLVDLTRTASDGSFSRGPRVVVSLLGAAEGRFTVVDADAPVRASVKKPLDELLTEAAAQLGAVVDAISGRGLAQAAKVELDEDVIASMTPASPHHVQAVVKALAEGKGPRDLLIDGAHAPQELESVLIDLARQGAITGVSGANGEDRIEAAKKARVTTQLPMRAPSLVPDAGARASASRPVPAAVVPPPPAAVVPPPPGGDDDEPALSVGSDSGEGDAEDGSKRTSGPDIGWLAGPDTSGNIVRKTLERPADEAVEEAERLSKIPKAMADEDATTTPGSVSAPALDALAAALDAGSDRGGDADDEDDDDRDDTQPGDDEAPPAKVEPAPEPKKAEAPAEKSKAKADKRKAPEKTASSKPASAEEPEKVAATEKGDGDGLGPVGWGFLVALLGIAGFMGYRVLFGTPATTAAVTTPPVTTAALPDTGVATVEDEPEVVEDEAVAVAPARRGYGTDEEGVTGIEIGTGEGAFVVVGRPGVVATVVLIADEGNAEHELTVPAGGTASLAVPEGLYAVTFVVGDQRSVRFTSVTAGHTRRLPLPE